MSDEPGIPEGGQAAQTHDWERDYKALQAEYTRSQQALKDADVWDDEEAVMQRYAEKFPHRLVGDDEEEMEDLSGSEYADEDPTADLRTRIEKFEAWQAQQVAKEGQALFAQDLKEVAGERTVSRQGRDWIELQVSRGSNNRTALEKATKEWFEYEDGLKGPTRKTTPTPPQPGTAAEVDYNASKDPNARRAARRARIAAQVEAGMQEQ